MSARGATAAIVAADTSEAALLLLCARASCSTEERQAIRNIVERGLDWPKLLAMANRHGLHPLLHRHLGAACPDLLPRTVQAELWSRHERLSRRNRAQAEELRRVLQSLQRAGIAAIPYKGPVLALRIHGDLSLREFGDLDLLLPRESVLAAKTLLLKDGYQPVYPLDEATERRLLDSPAHYHWVIARESTGHVIELHWRSDPDFPVEEKTWPAELHHRPEGEFDGVSYPDFERAELFLLLCLHGSKHHWSSLRWLVDIAELSRSLDDDDWQWMLSRARQLDATHRYAIALRMLADTLGGPTPSLTAAALPNNDRMQELASVLRAEMLSHAPPEIHALKRLQRDLELLDTARQRARFLLRTFFSPSIAELVRWRLPRALSPLYVPLRIFGLVAKRLPAFRVGAVRR